MFHFSVAGDHQLISLPAGSTGGIAAAEAGSTSLIGYNIELDNRWHTCRLDVDLQSSVLTAPSRYIVWSWVCRAVNVWNGVGLGA